MIYVKSNGQWVDKETGRPMLPNGEAETTPSVFERLIAFVRRSWHPPA